MISKSLRYLCAAALLAMLQPAVGAVPDYFSWTPVSSRYARALALNDSGLYAVNSAGPETPYEAASINGGPMSESVGSLGGPITRIRSLNNRGEAVGVSTTAEGEYRSFLYSGGRMQDLTARYGLYAPRDINHRGEIAAQTRDSRAAVLKDGIVHDFGPPNSTPGDMNERGELLVEYYSEAGGYHTAVYRDGALFDLPRIGGRQVFGQAINDAGWVTGYFTTAEGRNHAFLWDGGTVTDLTPGAGNGFGYDINSAGQVVGVVDDRAFLYADGQLIDLNTRIDPGADLLLKSADEINDRTQILSHSCDRSGVFCYGSVLLNPVPAVPEPPLIAILPVGLALLYSRRRASAGRTPPQLRRTVFDAVPRANRLAMPSSANQYKIPPLGHILRRVNRR